MVVPAQVEPPPTEAASPTPSKRRTHRGWIIAGAVVAGLVLVVVLFLALFDWDQVRGPVARFASARIGRPVAIDGHLHVKLLSWTPTATVEGLRVANPPGRPGDMTAIRRLTISVELRPLLHGKVILPLVQADQPNIALFRAADGTNNWMFKGASPGEPARLPAIRRFEINDGRLNIEDQVRHLKFTGTLASSEVVGAARVEGFRLRGDGVMNKEPFHMVLSGGPLLNVDPTRAYPFDAEVRAGASTILAKGSINKPFDFGVFEARLDLTGPDLADLYPLTGLTLPSSPPYKVAGTLTRDGHVFRYTGLNGRVGGSDLHGWIGVRTGLARPLLTGALNSNVLVLADLSAMLGGGTSRRSAIGPVKASQVKTAEVMKAESRLFPDTKLEVDRLRKMDADVTYRAGAIRSPTVPVRDGSVHVQLDNALLTLKDLTFGLPNGRLAGQVAINARAATPAVDLDMRMTGARLEQFLPARFASGSVNGTLVGRAKLHGTGSSVRQAAATANGTFAVVVPHGEIRAAFAELMGVDVVKGLGLLLSKSQEKTDIRCAVADFQAKNGVLTADQLVFDTEPVLVTGGGTIDLRNETLNLVVKGKPKQFRLVRLIVPIELKGRLVSPKIGIETGTAVGQVGIGAALGTVLAPLAAILPFVDGGLAKDANCAGLMTAAPAPVTAKQIAQAPPVKSRR